MAGGLCTGRERRFGIEEALTFIQSELIPNPWRDGKGDTGLMSLYPYPVCTQSESLEGYAWDRKGGMVLKKSLFFYPV